MNAYVYTQTYTLTPPHMCAGAHTYIVFKSVTKMESKIVASASYTNQFCRDVCLTFVSLSHRVIRQLYVPNFIKILPCSESYFFKALSNCFGPQGLPL